MSKSDETVTIHAGPHDRSACPVRVPLTSPLSGDNRVLVADDGARRAAQIVNGNEIVFLETDLAAGASRTYRIQPSSDSPSPAIMLEDESGQAIAIRDEGTLITRYIYGDVPARPYFHPLIAPTGAAITRAYPMEKGVAGESADHPHHRSLWIAYGSANGADNWSESEGHGFTQHQTLDILSSGQVFGQFATTSLWTQADAAPVLTQRLKVTTWSTPPDVRLLDFDIQLEATHGDVFFEDTKEGGILSARVASILDVPRGGRIENVFGGINEAETWGYSAHWCDYSGTVAGQTVGIAILDHPMSFRYPTYWHVRDYGLMTANPFGLSAYTNGVKNGSLTLPSGASLDFHYRIVLHLGNAREGVVPAHYLNFVSPPRVVYSAIQP